MSYHSIIFYYNNAQCSQNIFGNIYLMYEYICYTKVDFLILSLLICQKLFNTLPNDNRSNKNRPN